MAHLATLHLGTATGVNEYEILSFNYEFDQALNLGPVHGLGLGRAIDNLSKLMSWTTGEVTGGVITLKIATLPDNDTIFHRWMFSRWRPMSGTIRVEMDAPQSAHRFFTVVFSNGYCTHLKDEFDSQSGKVMTTTIKITCQQITIGANIPAVWPAFI